MTIKIVHGTFRWYYPVYRNTNKIIPNIPLKFRVLILEKHEKFLLELIKQKRILEFTFGLDDEFGICSIAIVHPLDHFSRKIGYNIVKGRIERIKNGVKPYLRLNKEGHYKEYIPKFIEVL